MRISIFQLAVMLTSCREFSCQFGGFPLFGNQNQQNPFFGQQPQQGNQLSNPFFGQQSFVFPDFQQNQFWPQNNFGQQTQRPQTSMQLTQRPQTTKFTQRPISQTQRPISQTQRPISQTQKPISQQNQDRISKRKCDEYGELVKKKVQVVSLSLEASSQDITFTQCDSVTGLVVGGVNAQPAEFPHMAAIGYPHLDGTLSFACGGSLISELFVLTAAHCSKADRVSPTMVRLGDLNLKERENGLDEVEIPIERFIKHEAYDPETRENDIALVKMKYSARFSRSIRPACLQQTESIAKPRATATGWGYTEVAGMTSDILQKVQLDIIDNQRCREAYKDEDNYHIYNSQLCAGILAGGKDTCGGDSGGPLQIAIGNECVFSLIGVTSYGSTFCGDKNSPGIYARVSSYLDWIERNVWG